MLSLTHAAARRRRVASQTRRLIACFIWDSFRYIELPIVRDRAFVDRFGFLDRVKLCAPGPTLWYRRYCLMERMVRPSFSLAGP
jgi:hypothetical protein